MKRALMWFAMLVILAAVFFFSSATADMVAEGICGADLTWTLSDEGVLTISGSGQMDDFSDYYYGGDKPAWMSLKSSITSVIIEEGVTSVGSYAFFSCKALTSVTMPDVVRIGAGAFKDCTGIAEIIISSDLSYVGDSAFLNCSALLICPKESAAAVVLSKKYYSFRENGSKYNLQYQYDSGWNYTGMMIAKVDKDIVELEIPADVTMIAGGAMDGCSKLESVTIPGTVTFIGQKAFYGCSNLATVELPDGITEIKSETFRSCRSLKTVRLPKNLTAIWASAFYGCSELESIDLPAGVTTIGNWAFGGCSRLKSFDWPANITAIGEGVFASCDSLTQFDIPSTVTSIGKQAFYSCDSLACVVIPESVTSIGETAFAHCGALKSATVPSSIETFGPNIFFNCGSLADIRLANGLKMIGAGAFDGCKSLCFIHIPDSVTSIGGGVFESCSNLEAITLPPDITSIDRYTFRYCTKLASITIPDKVTSVDYQAFDGCDNLKTYVFPRSVRSFPFIGSGKTIYCYEMSAADGWASENNHTIIYLDGFDPDTIRTLGLQQDFRLAIGESKALAADVFPSYDQPVVSWVSDDPDIVSVSDQGVVTAHSAGTATITASVGSLTDTVAITSYRRALSFSLSDTEIWVAGKGSIPLSIRDTDPADAQVFLSWNVSDTNTAVVSDNGLVTAKAAGDVTVSAVSEYGIHRECLIHVCYPVQSVAFSDASAVVPVNDTLQLNAVVQTTDGQVYSNKLVTFSSSNPAVLEVDAVSGVVWPAGIGMAEVTAVSSNGKTAVIQVTVVCSVHQIVPDPAVEPTCTKTGLTEGSHCEVCGYIETAQTVIPARGHEWGEPEYSWAADYSEVTAIRTCGRDNTHIETETVPAAVTYSNEPTCMETGVGTYTSGAFSNAAFTVQEKADVVIPALGHDWKEPTCVWSADNTQVTATMVCRNDDEHVITEVATVSRTVLSSPTQDTAGTVQCIAEFTSGFDPVSKTLPIPALKNLDVLVLPEDLVTIEEGAFTGAAMEAVIIPEGCRSIGSCAFANCRNLLYVYLPGDLTDIDPDSFDGSALAAIERGGVTADTD